MAERTGDIDNPESKEPSEKQPGTILVYDVPSELSQNDLWIYFQKKKNSGGEVLEVSMKSESGKALVNFEDCKVAKAVVQHPRHVIKGHAINVKLYNEDKDKKSRTVLVSGLPNDATENRIKIHFQKKKNGGGEIEDVKVLEKGKALVVFEESKVAKAIVNTKQIFNPEKAKVLTLERMDMEWDSLRAVKQGDADFAGKENRTVLVSDLPPEATKNGVFIHFQKKKNKGGEVEEATLLPETNEAWVIFEDPEVAKAVASTDQIILGKQVGVKLLKTETQPIREPTDPSVTPGTILVSGLPGGATEHSIAMHFQTETNGKDEVKKVEILPEGKQARVTFNDIEVAIKAASTTPVIANTQVTVTLLDNEKELERKIPSEVLAKTEVAGSPAVETPIDSVDTHSMTRQIHLGNPSEARVEKINSGGGNQFVLVRQVDQVFSKVSAIVQHELLNTAPKSFWTDVIPTCGVQYEDSPVGPVLTGTLSQVAKAGELLDLKQRQHWQDMQSRNVAHNTVSYQAGTTVTQHGIPFTPRHMNFNQINMSAYRYSTPINQPFTNARGTIMSQVGASFNQAPANLSQNASIFHPSGTNFNQMGSPLNPQSTTFNQGITNFNNSGGNVPQHRITFNQSGTANSIGRQDHMRSGAFSPPEGSHFNQQDVNYSSDPRYQQSRGDTERQWANEEEHKRDNNHTTRDTQHHHLDNDVRYHQPSDSKHFSNKEGSKNSQSFGKTPDVHQEYTGRPSCLDEADPRGGQTQTPHFFGNPSHQQQTFWEQDNTSQNMTDQTSVTLITSTDTTKTTQPLENAQNGTSTGDTTGAAAEYETQKVDGNFPLDKKETSLGGTTIPNPPVTNPQTSTPHAKLQRSTTSHRQFAPALSNTSGHQNEKSTKSPDTNPSSQPPVGNQPSITSNVPKEPKISTTSGKQVESPSNDTADSGSKKTPIVTESTTHPHPVADHRESTILKTASEEKKLTTSSNPHLNETSKCLGGKQPSASETTMSVPPQDDDQPGTITDRITGPQTSTNSNHTDGSSSNDQKLPIETQPAESATILQTTSDDQTDTIHNPGTVGSSDEQTTPSTITSGYLGDKQSDITEKTLNNKQQQTTHDQISNQETHDNHPTSKSDVLSSKLATPSKNAKASPQRPTPKPRHNKPTTNERRQNAANFSSSTVKTKQPGQDSSSPTEPNTNSVNDKPAAASEPKEGGQKETTQNPKITDERNDIMMEEEVD